MNGRGLMYMKKICFIIANIIKEWMLFAIGGVVYVLIECLWRGYSHPTMFIVGGLCFVIVGLLNELFTEEMSLLFQSLIGSIIITIVEFISGYILNIRLGLHVWDYSDMPLNVMGQICLPFFLLWIVMAGIAVVVDDIFREAIFSEPHVTYHLFPKMKKDKIP